MQVCGVGACVCVHVCMFVSVSMCKSVHNAHMVLLDTSAQCCRRCRAGALCWCGSMCVCLCLCMRVSVCTSAYIAHMVQDRSVYVYECVCRSCEAAGRDVGVAARQTPCVCAQVINL
jgi:hypothetical protein